MHRRAKFLTLAVAAATVAACDAGPLGVVPSRSDPSITSGASPSVGVHPAASSSGVSKTSITGTIGQLGVGVPGRQIITPSGRCHFRDWPVYNEFHGDVAGAVTFHEKANTPCDFSDFVGSGPFGGEVTWNGRTGTIAGQWTTNCEPAPSLPLGLSCAGTMNARGSGGLDGVQFHFRWGPGWYPFAYTGTAFSN